MQKGQILIWIIVGALVIATVGGYFIYTNYLNNKPKPVPKNPVATSQVDNKIVSPDNPEGWSCGKLAGPAGDATCPLGYTCDYSNSANHDIGTCIKDKQLDETATWKTYTNDDLGISFKYPSDWNTPLTTNLSVHIEKDPDLRMIVGACPGYSFSIAKYDHLSNYSSYKPTKLGKVDKEPVQVFEQTNQYGCYTKIIFVNKPPEENYTPRLVISMIQKDTNLHVLDQILSTFKFTQ